MEMAEEGESIISLEDVLATKAALNEIAERASDSAALVAALNQKIKSKEISTAKGMSFYDVKTNLMVQYLLGVSGITSTKVRGQSIQDSPYVDQLVEIRTVVDKIRPIDQKLKYQVEKLVRSAQDGKVEADPLRHRANLDNLNEADSEESSESEDEDRKTGSSNNVYRPPKVASLPYDDEETPAKQMENVRKKYMNKALIKEMGEELLDTPVEIGNSGDAFAMELSRHAVDKQRFEETYMTRLPETKRDKHSARKVSTIGVLGDEITDFRVKRTSSSSKGKGTKRKKSKGSKASNAKKFRKK